MVKWYLMMVTTFRLYIDVITETFDYLSYGQKYLFLDNQNSWVNSYDSSEKIAYQNKTGLMFWWGFFFITFKFVNHLNTWKLNIQSVKTPWIWRYHHNNLLISIFCIAKTPNRAISLLLKNFQYTGN